ncbi:hypothetical protein [Caldimonas tepidiphila]|uniref:hypothetical protein n=1 Tax=Caldimonas tepidiphila TaxID=2315841 RepID=UPI000E5BE766|nr:hypothetical protein [Caldimonas tepidiphila]
MSAGSGLSWLPWLFVAAFFLCGLALAFSRWPAWAKGALVLAVTGLYFVAEHTLASVAGWPAQAPLPERFVLLALVVEEPSAKGAGSLTLWVNAIENGRPAAEPRAHRLPYTRELHALLNESMKKARQGISQLGTAEPKPGPKGLSWLRPGADEQNVKLRDLPVPQLPEK